MSNDDCLEKDCLRCENHTLISGKVYCNKDNRLGTSTSTLENMLGREKSDAEG